MRPGHNQMKALRACVLAVIWLWSGLLGLGYCRVVVLAVIRRNAHWHWPLRSTGPLTCSLAGSRDVLSIVCILIANFNHMPSEWCSYGCGRAQCATRSRELLSTRMHKQSRAERGADWLDHVLRPSPDITAARRPRPSKHLGGAPRRSFISLVRPLLVFLLAGCLMSNLKGAAPLVRHRHRLLHSPHPQAHSLHRRKHA